MSKLRLLLNRAKQLGYSKTSRKRVNDVKFASNAYGQAWLNSQIPHEQWTVVEPQLESMRSGSLTPEFQCFCDAVTVAIEMQQQPFQTLLEIGCSSGYYGQLVHERFPTLHYHGIDFSQDFINLGKTKFPNIELSVGDTTDLQLEDNSYDIVVSGSVLLHVLDWKIGVRETCRVARHFVVLHRTPVSMGYTTLYTKIAYGTTMCEWTFNEDELLQEFERHSFRLVRKTAVYPGQHLGKDPDEPVQFTYLLQRIH